MKQNKNDQMAYNKLGNLFKILSENKKYKKIRQLEFYKEISI